MNDTTHQEWHRLFSAALNDTLTDEEKRQLAALLKSSAEARQLWFLYHDNECGLAELKHAAATTSEVMAAKSKVQPQRQTARWQQWRPLTAAAAGLAIGLFSASVVYGFVSQRMGVVKKVPLVVYDPGLENAEASFARSLPKGVGQWGADSATVVMAENGVRPLQGQRMLRLDPIPREKDVKNHASRVYQVLALRSLPILGVAGDVEVQVTASFSAANADVTSRYLIRAFALNETPEQATKGFWPKTQEDGVVSVAQRFETSAGDRGWHTFSLKMPLPRGAQSLVFILGAEPVDDASPQTSPHYLDDVHVSVLIPQAAMP